jgi:hypothetical protein
MLEKEERSNLDFMGTGPENHPLGFFLYEANSSLSGFVRFSVLVQVLM